MSTTKHIAYREDSRLEQCQVMSRIKIRCDNPVYVIFSIQPRSYPNPRTDELGVCAGHQDAVRADIPNGEFVLVGERTL